MALRVGLRYDVQVKDSAKAELNVVQDKIII